MAEKQIVIDRKDWEGMQIAVIAELKSAHIAVKVLSVQLDYINEEIEKFPSPKKEKVLPSGVG